MDDLTAQLEALLFRHARWLDPGSDPASYEQSVEQFRKEMKVLIATFGQAAVDAALDEMPEESWPSVSLH